jgi:hypothetical protein
LLGPQAERWFAHEIGGDVADRVADEPEHGTVAQVDTSDVDEALDLVTLATDFLRVFQKKGARFRTTMFGLPGQVYRSNVRYFTVGEEGGPAFRNRGEVLGSTLNEETHAAWQASRTFASLAAQVGADGPLDEGARRALLGVQLLSPAVLEHRPAFKILNLIIALESMLLERNHGPQTLRLLRRATYFTCGRAYDSMCGWDRAACQFLALAPAIRGDRQQLDWLRRLAEMGPPWRCGEWLSYAHWYDLRSSVTHGDDEPVPLKRRARLSTGFLCGPWNRCSNGSWSIRAAHSGNSTRPSRPLSQFRIGRIPFRTRLHTSLGTIRPVEHSHRTAQNW